MVLSFFEWWQIIMETKTIQRPDGTKIVYDEYGDRQRQTLFLLHGNGDRRVIFGRKSRNMPNIFM